MDDEWSLVKNDCLLFSPSLSDDFCLPLTQENIASLSSVKMEPLEVNEGQGSSSTSPSSLSDSLGVPDYTPLSLHTNTLSSSSAFLTSPSSSNGCVLGSGECNVSMLSPSLVSPLAPSLHTSLPASPLQSSLPPVSHFSSLHRQSTVHYEDSCEQLSKYKEECMHSLSPISSSSSPSSPALSPSPSHSTLDSLYREGLQVRTRSKMHEMALQHRLITEQDPRGTGIVHLSSEERRTLLQEGYSVPSKLPLSKADEEALRIVRRKIKNKLSAQESRRKRKEYMDNLEQRCQLYATENAHLKSRLKHLESQLKKCQSRV